MTTPPNEHESKMLAEVRRWRKEAYDADQVRSPQERAEQLDDLVRRFGLSKVEDKPERPSRRSVP